MTYRLGRGAVLAVYTLVIAVPLLIVVFGTFKTTQELFASPLGLPAQATVANYATVLADGQITVALRNSILVTTCVVVLTLAVASAAAFAFARLHGGLAAAAYGFVIAGLAIPVQAAMVPQFVLFDLLGLTDSLVGLVVVQTVTGLPVAVFILTGFMRTLPRELFEAADVDGASPWRTFRSVVLPLSTPSLAAAAIFLLVISWNDLLYPLLFITDPAKQTLPLALLGFTGEYLTDYPLLFTGVVVASLPLALAYVLLQRWFVAGLTAGSVKG
ncbi:carbohydrate ABC transporter permease [Pseudonocardia sp. KRD-184]|uniref:Carbohydrate ABC transporter permease n=1 Tax=Pseudonocardia oceani TaxID=2792013 RepID=A0ABS6UIK9_9PSEU|nr:carbohydrate ABC transporter permease [Pseudonocardia oceani]MBW0091511.1 carbohydrate ABC transporter permease [Pseudonocardia oceani]MBW0097021.1 carbohydrate ABC transporter permease [Pseudonocardia oceani]MBW0111176.1 carbohydrate ABC transporter permease [Pseudonocardia oceani]MBW0122669.1 carbohydrate ABC transporter permease [Pseudonocardia oceani]MBW0132080.1 carbohydrate ABC transporter permease [Pseudonocardia oceani]